jgi:hypothetical protein
MAKKEVVKRVKNAVLYSDGSIRVDTVRLSYPHLARPQVETDDDGNKKGESYSGKFQMPKATHRAAKDLLKEAIEGLLKEHKLKALPSEKKFLRDGDQSGKPEDEGMFLISAREKKRPSCRHRNKSPMDKEEIEERLYGGAWVTVLIKPWFQSNGFGKRVNANLLAVQEVRGLDPDGNPYPDAKPYGEGRISESDIDEVFDSYDDDDDADSGFSADDDDEL